MNDLPHGGANPDRVEVTLPKELPGSRAYSVLIGTGLLEVADAYLRPFTTSAGIVLVADRQASLRQIGRLRPALDRLGGTRAEILVEPGEGSKNLQEAARILDHAAAAGLERGSLILAFGGGVVGDLAGFCAAILLRGLPLIQIPTTLLAQIDSSVGGKTGVNLKTGKNLVGAFHQPCLVLADLDVLATLPEREIRAGYSEIVKYALIADASFLAWLEEHVSSILSGRPDLLREAVRRAVVGKATIVARDETEQGERALLNLGHSFAHAIEAEAGYGMLLHGEAVAIGLCLAFALSYRLGLCTAHDHERVRLHLLAAGLPVVLPATLRDDPDRLIARMRHDKKMRDGKLTFVLARGIGQAFLARDVTLADLRYVLS